METRIGKMVNKKSHWYSKPGDKPEFSLSSSGFWAYVPKFATTWKYYSVNNVTISTHRNFVEHSMPGRNGSVFQDMGRPAIRIVVEGNLNESGMAAEAFAAVKSKVSMLSHLHEMCDEGLPLAFNCDMPALFGVHAVVIENLEASEAHGRKYNYDYKLTLREWTEAPPRNLVGKFQTGRAWDLLKNKERFKVVATVAVAGAVIGGGAAALVALSSSQAKPLVVTMMLYPSSIFYNQSSAVSIVVFDNKGTRVKDMTVGLSVDAGSISPASVTTDDQGKATATFTGDVLGTCKITADASSNSGYTSTPRTGQVVVNPMPLSTTLKLSAKEYTIGKSSDIKIEVTVTDKTGAGVKDVAVAMTASTGSVAAASLTTDDQGKASTTFKGSTKGTSTITATASKANYAGSPTVDTVTVK